MNEIWRTIRHFFIPKCRHHWRPARTSKGLARHCLICERTEKLTQAQFYAYFGRYFPE